MAKGRKQSSKQNPAESADPSQNVQLETVDLLASVEALAKLHNLPYSEETALQGLPVSGKSLPHDLFNRCAARIGLETEYVQAKPSEITAMVYPFVLLFKDGTSAIAVDKDINQNEILVQSHGADTLKRIRASSLDKDCLPVAILATVDPTRRSHQERESAELERTRHWLWSAVTPLWPSWAYVALAALIINLLGLALPLFVLNVYDRVIPNNSIPTLWALALGVAIAIGFDFILRVLRAIIINNSGRRIDMKVSSRLFEHAVDIKMEERVLGAGETASHIREFESVRDFFTSTGLVSLIDLFFIGLFLWLLWYLVGPLAIVAMVAVPVVLAATILFNLPLARAVRRAHASAAQRHSVLVEALTAIGTVKAINAESTLQRRWENAVASSVRAGSASQIWSAIAVNFTMLAQQSVSVLIIIWGVFLIAAGELTIGALVASNILAGRILAPLGSIAVTIVRTQQALSAYGFLNKMMALPRDHEPAIDGNAKIAAGRLEFNNMSFNYPGQNVKALDSVSMTIAPGERVGIIGRVGSGKSTFGKLMINLYSPAEGAVMIDGTDTRHHAAAVLRKAVHYVGQETELFTGTLKDNLLIGNPEDQDQLETATNASGIAGFIQANPLGLEMPVGEGGKSLSGGQRQAVGIARAIMANPKIMFLDEPTGQMDNLTEAAFLRAFSNWLSGDMTLLIATHRASMLALVNRLVVIDKGKIIADGPKDTVLASLPNGNPVSPGRKGK